MTIYLDSDFRCHISYSQGFTAVETDFFDGKCAGYIEGYRYIPGGETWTRPDGQTFAGEMIAPAEDSRTLEAVQTAYEQGQAQAAARLSDMQAALEVLGVEP